MTSITPLQCTLINSTPLNITETKDIGFPMAPMITAKYYKDNHNLVIKIRAVVFVDSLAGINAITSQSNFPVLENGNVLNLTIEYNYTEDNPTSFYCFYIEFDYSSQAVKSGTITQITSFLKDMDPVTSRGTTTNVAPL